MYSQSSVLLFGVLDNIFQSARSFAAFHSTYTAIHARTPRKQKTLAHKHHIKRVTQASKTSVSTRLNSIIKYTQNSSPQWGQCRSENHLIVTDDATTTTTTTKNSNFPKKPKKNLPERKAGDYPHTLGGSTNSPRANGKRMKTV